MAPVTERPDPPQRRLLGYCTTGRLLVGRNKGRASLNLFLLSPTYAADGLSRELQKLVARDARRAEARQRKVAEGTFWLCRLPQGAYHVQNTKEGGCLLWQLYPSWQGVLKQRPR
jgi:hypothetical protein